MNRRDHAEGIVSDSAPSTNTKRTALIVAAVVVVLALEAVAVALVFLREGATSAAEQERLASSPVPDVWWHEKGARGIVRPATVQASESGLAPDEEVVGIVVGGQARAYRLGAFHDQSGHLVNDVVNEVPASVVYCDVTDCLRVWTGPRHGAPLAMEVAGQLNGGMVLEVNGGHYAQATGEPIGHGEPFPYTLLEAQRTTWRDWLRQYPETDVYLGARTLTSPTPYPQPPAPRPPGPTAAAP